MTVDVILFFILALISVISAVSMLLSRNAVYSALFLIINFGTIASFYLMLGAPFLAIGAGHGLRWGDYGAFSICDHASGGRTTETQPIDRLAAAPGDHPWSSVIN